MPARLCSVSTILLLSLLGPIPIGAAADDAPAGFAPIFNGRDLAGWSVDGGDAAAWSVEDGAIVARGRDYRTRSYLLTDREYSDFVVRLEFRLEEGAGAGIALRAVAGERVPVSAGQLIFDHPIFKLLDISGREETGTTNWMSDGGPGGLGVKPDQAAEMRGPESWNALEIEVRGQSMRATVNGKVVLSGRVATGEDPPGVVSGLRRRKGRVGLQKHTRTVRYRNIAIREIPPDPASTSGPGGFVPLFNRRDLAGWSVEPGPRGSGGWGVEGGAIVARGHDYRTRNYLLTDREYSDFELRLEFQLEGGGNAGIGLRVSPGERMPLVDGSTIFDHPIIKLRNAFQSNEQAGTTHWVLGPMYVQPDRPAQMETAGSWNRLEVVLKGRAIHLAINGRPVLDGELAAGATLSNGAIPGLGRAKGRIGLQKHTGTVRYRNIMIRELDGGLVPPEVAKDASGSTRGGEAASPTTRASGTLHVLAIGINDYPDRRLRLDCAAPDARSLRQAFLTHSRRLFRGVEARLLIDGEATRAHILAELGRLSATVQPGDVAVVFYAGHGDYQREGQLYLVPVDADVRNLKHTGISGEELKKAIVALPCTAMLVLDACYAGSFDLGARKTRALPGRDDVALRDLVYDPGLVVLCGADKDQEAAEEDGKGFFTRAIVDGLSGPADLDKDGVVELDELDMYVRRRVRSLSNGDQEPTISIPSTVRSFALSRP